MPFHSLPTALVNCSPITFFYEKEFMGWMCIYDKYKVVLDCVLLLQGVTWVEGFILKYISRTVNTYAVHTIFPKVYCCRSTKHLLFFSVHVYHIKASTQTIILSVLLAVVQVAWTSKLYRTDCVFGFNTTNDSVSGYDWCGRSEEDGHVSNQRWSEVLHNVTVWLCLAMPRNVSAGEPRTVAQSCDTRQ